MRAGLLAACITAAIGPAPAEVIRFDGTDEASTPDAETGAGFDLAVLRYDASGRLIHPDPAAPARDASQPVVLAQPGSVGPAIQAVRQAAARYQDHPALKGLGLSPRDWQALFQAMVRVESGFHQSAVSPAGAIGLAQLMPATARALRVDANDSADNLDGGARYLLAQLARFGSLELALAAYNAGPDAVERYGGIPPYAETEAHVRKVMAEYHRLLASL